MKTLYSIVSISLIIFFAHVCLSHAEVAPGASAWQKTGIPNAFKNLKDKLTKRPEQDETKSNTEIRKLPAIDARVRQPQPTEFVRQTVPFPSTNQSSTTLPRQGKGSTSEQIGLQPKQPIVATQGKKESSLQASTRRFFSKLSSRPSKTIEPVKPASSWQVTVSQPAPSILPASSTPPIKNRVEIPANAATASISDSSNNIVVDPFARPKKPAKKVPPPTDLASDLGLPPTAKDSPKENAVPSKDSLVFKEVAGSKSDVKPVVKVGVKTPEAQPATTTEPTLVSKLKTEPTTRVSTTPIAKVETKPSTIIETKPATTVQTKPVEVAETSTVPKHEIKPYIITETKPATKVQTKPVEVAETSTVPKHEIKPYAITATKPATKVQTKPVEVAETSTVPKHEIKPYAITETKPATKVLKNPGEVAETTIVPKHDVKPFAKVETVQPLKTNTNSSGMVVVNTFIKTKPQPITSVVPKLTVKEQASPQTKVDSPKFAKSETKWVARSKDSPATTLVTKPIVQTPLNVEPKKVAKRQGKPTFNIAAPPLPHVSSGTTPVLPKSKRGRPGTLFSFDSLTPTKRPQPTQKKSVSKSFLDNFAFMKPKEAKESKKSTTLPSLQRLLAAKKPRPVAVKQSPTETQTPNNHVPVQEPKGDDAAQVALVAVENTEKNATPAIHIDPKEQQNGVSPKQPLTSKTQRTLGTISGQIDRVNSLSGVVSISFADNPIVRVGTRFQVKHRNLFGSSLVGEVEIVSSQGGIAIAQAVGDIRLSKVSRGDRVEAVR